MKTENFTPSDVRNVIEKLTNMKTISLLKNKHFSRSEDANNNNSGEKKKLEYQISKEDIQSVLKDFKTHSIQGVSLQKFDTTWEDVGGMEEIKKIIRETIEYPTKFPSLFENAPIKLRSGLLLYGYPGCGKTHIAHAVARECQLNFITVKGPELLNKYVGASEEAVRKLFEQAESAKPCCVFFDEFESIAPNRGNDNTGVTDRVVNQLLCQLDGVESREGVYVLAATNRPDLIDAALLRPGRLDKSIFCNFPTISERKKIIGVLCRKINISEDVDIDELAEKTKNYSSADLQGLIYNANLDAIHQKMRNTDNLDHDEVLDELGIDEDEKEEMKEDEPSDYQYDVILNESDDTLKSVTREQKQTLEEQAQDTIKSLQKMKRIIEQKEIEEKGDTIQKQNITVHQSNFLNALKETAPSLSETERQRFTYIYETYSKSKKTVDNPDNTASMKQRVTLA